jgi:hypothetical protein
MKRAEKQAAHSPRYERHSESGEVRRDATVAKIQRSMWREEPLSSGETAYFAATGMPRAGSKRQHKGRHPRCLELLRRQAPRSRARGRAEPWRQELLHTRVGVVSSGPTLKYPSRPSGPRETPLAGSRHVPHASCASCLLFVFRAVCAYARCRRRSTWPGRSFESRR